MADLLLGHTSSPKIRYVAPEDGAELRAMDTPITKREWDVTDPTDRETAGRVELGDDYDWHVEHLSAQWWIDSDRNAAGLAIYRLPQVVEEAQ